MRMLKQMFSLNGSRIAVLPLIIFLCADVSAQESSAVRASGSSTGGKATTVIRDEEGLYRIGPGDLLDIRVAKHEELSLQSIRVDNNGFIRLPRIDSDIKAACLTEKALAEEIEKRMWFLRRPDVHVSIKEFNSKPVSVIGAVNAPGRFQLQRQVRLLELVALVNGPAPQAGSVIHVIHMGGAGGCAEQTAGENQEDVIAGFTEYNIDETMRASAASNPIIQPGDIVRIPEAPEAPRAYILGGVKNPQAIPLKQPVTITQAIAIANGATPGANTEKIKIIRQSPGGNAKTEILVSLKSINTNRAEDIALQPNDIVDVPGTGSSGRGKSILMGLGRILMPSAFPFPVQVLR